MANLKVFQNTDLRLTNFTFQPLGKEMEMMLRFQGEEYRAPSSLHTTRKVAQKDPIFPP